MMIKKICHLADIHIRKTPTRNDEYQAVFKELIKQLKKDKPDRIVIVGDLVHDYLDLQGEQLIMANKLLKDLSLIAPVRITRGNHDFRKKNHNRVDSIRAIVETLGDYDVKYYNKTGFEIDDNIMWAVWHHGSKNNNPWKSREGKKIESDRNSSDYVHIDLFHDPISGCKSTTGFEMTSKSYYKISDFKGDLSFFGDIHKSQFLDKNQTKAYCGSLIAQDISEGDGDFHGYYLWDVETKTAELVPIKSPHSYYNLRITPYTDFEELDFEIDEVTESMTIRFLWGTLPQTRNAENERLINKFIKEKYGNVKVLHKNEFIEDDEIDINENITLENVSDAAVQEEIIREYLSKIGANEQMINDIIALDHEILNEIDITNEQNIEWDIIRFGGNNFMSYEKLDIDWRNINGLFQIEGGNTYGKTTIMKLISYILFGKTLETENRIKFGDMRFINNRNGATYCDAYMVLEANGEYFGIKRRTDLETKRDGTINGAPTKLSYYILSNPDDDMTDDNIIEKLDGDKRTKTQETISSIIGTYENFKRIVMTTSDTLNANLSNDMAIFIDSLLYDSGLDIFDKKLEGWKIINKRNNEKNRVSCNVEQSTTQITTHYQEIDKLMDEIKEIETVTLPKVQDNIRIGREYLETQTKKLYKIDPEIYSLDVEETKRMIGVHTNAITDIEAREVLLKKSIDVLSEKYDEVRLNELIIKQDSHKQLVYDKKFKIKEIEREIATLQHEIEIINGKSFNLKRDGKKLLDEINDLKNSKVCSQCHQLIDKKEHQDHILNTVKTKEIEMFAVAKEIKDNDANIRTNQEVSISNNNQIISDINEDIIKGDLEMENIMKEIGTLTNQKNDVERRNILQLEVKQIPIEKQNKELSIEILNQKLVNYNNSLIQIEENIKTEKIIEASKLRLGELEIDETDKKEDIFTRKTLIGEKQMIIKNLEQLIKDFKTQEYQDSVMELYKKCVHRDGIPRQMLSSYIIPKINLTLEKILSVALFKVWLDPDDLRPKLIYHSRPDAIIDCIGASGKERTFSSVVLKFALNQINVKAKPSVFLLDEVMGKLDANSVEEFREILQLIKVRMKKVLVIEQKEEINPDYLINVSLDDDGISSLTIE